MDYKEIKRQSLHLLFGMALVILYYFEHISARDVFFMLIAGILVFFINKNKKIKYLEFFIKHFERADNNHEGLGVLTYMLGAFLTMLIFGSNKNLVCASLVVLAIGDSVSPIVGIHLGKIKFKYSEKKIEGIIAGIIASSVIASLFITWYIAFIAASVAMIFEAFDYSVDDNISIPLISASVIFILQIWL